MNVRAFRGAITGYLIAVLMVSPLPAQDPEPVQARIVLHNKQTWNVYVLGRFRKEWLLIRKEGEQGTIELPTSDIRRIDFPLKIDPPTVLDQYASEAFDEVIQLVAQELEPYRPYVMEAASNTDAVFSILMKSLYWAGQVDQALAVADQILTLASRERPWLDAAVVRSLCLVEKNDIEGAAAIMDELEIPSDEDAMSAMAGYAAAKVQMRRGALDEAQETLARLIAYRSRDFEWMPAALFLSAEGYARAGQADVARQVVEEIKLNYPIGRWIKLAEALPIDTLLPPPPEE